MKSLYMKLSVVLITVLLTQKNIAQNSYNNDNYRYDLSDYLDLEAVASVFSKSRNISDFENRLNDYRNQVSNLDLNNDGYVDYLRLVKLYDRNAHVILIQAVLGRNTFQDVATVVVERDNYNRDYIQFIGDPYLYGNDYILEPTFRYRPSIVRWLWSNTNYSYVSRYYWGYYPRYYRLRYLLPIPHYFNHIRVFVDVHHRYHYTTHRRHSLSFEGYHSHSRNDYWKHNSNQRFDQRNRDIRNKGYFQHNQARSNPDPKSRQYRDVNPSESQRRDINSGSSPQRDTRVSPSRDTQVAPQRDTRVSPSRDTQVSPQPQRDTKVTPSRDTRVTPQRDVQVSPQRNPVATPQKEVKATPQREVRVTPSREATKVTPKTETRQTTKKEPAKKVTTRDSKESERSTRR